MQFRRERIGHRLFPSRRDLQTVSLRCEILDDDRWIRRARHVQRSQQSAADDLDGDGGGLVVGDIEQGAGGMAVDQFDPEDFRLREGGADFHGEVRGLEFVLVGEVVLQFFDLVDLQAC